MLNIPGTTLDITSDKSLSVSHPLPDDSVKAIFKQKADYLTSYKSDWQSWIDAEKATWAHRSTDLVAQLSLWWEPLLAMAPTLRKLVNGNCLIQTDVLNIYIDFAEGRVRLHDGEDYSFRFTISRDLLETVITRRAVDWSNSLFLSARFSAWRAGEYNEYLYNFFKSLSVERMNRTEAEAVRTTKSSDVVESDVEIGDFVVQRRCPHL
ncbi:MAG: (2Fe-2S)-binding protein, partial [Actinomycetota bacterium]